MSTLQESVTSRHSSRVNNGVIWRIGVLIVGAALLFYNLGFNPPPRHDEGGVLSLAKTLAREGVYATRSGDEYQTFGSVQSAGPTLIIPVAASMRLFGVGLWQGRVVVALWSVLALILFFQAGLRLSGVFGAACAIGLLLSSPFPSFLYFGRQAVGDIPALAFFLAGWMRWATAIEQQRRSSYLLAGLLFGGAMVTKSQYTLIAGASLGLVALLDLTYYRQRVWAGTLGCAAVAVTCVAAWSAWQYLYFGPDLFRENAAKLTALSHTAIGFSPQLAIKTLRSTIDNSSGYLFMFWGAPALLYALASSTRRSREGLITVYLSLFTMLWLAYYLLLTIPSRYLQLPPGAIMALFVGALWQDLARQMAAPGRRLVNELRQGRAAALALLLAMGLTILYPLQNVIQFDVLEGRDQVDLTRYALQTADWLDRNTTPDALIETKDREIDILTARRYHFPDDAIFEHTNAALFRSGPQDYALGAAYFARYRPAYLVVGWFARWQGIYDPAYLATHAEVVARFSDGNDLYGSEIGYTIYRIRP